MPTIVTAWRARHFLQRKMNVFCAEKVGILSTVEQRRKREASGHTAGGV